MSFETFVHVFLAFYFTFVAVHYTVRLVALHQRTGIRHAHPGGRIAENRVNQIVFRLFRTAIWAAAVLVLLVPGATRWLGPISWFEGVVPQSIGMLAMVAALGWVDYVHSYMHVDWRSGMNDDPTGTLVTDGPFALSRNPTFMGILLGQVGLFLALPSAFTLICLLMGATVILRQMRLEERHMPARFGEAYQAYAAATPRWMTQSSLARFVGTKSSSATGTMAAE